jgi:DNA (cytosine-5)-methyltransferase 1
MRFGSLYSGIGGADLGLTWAGHEIVWQCEISEFCNSVLKRRWPTVRRWNDVRTFPPPAAESWEVDAIFGGFPCKQTSLGAAVHGRRTGLAGADSGLWWHMLRIVREQRPRWAIVENTPGAKTWSATIEGGLADAGYSVQRLELEAADFGAAHRRRRVFWIANRYGARFPFARPSGPSEAERFAWRAAAGDAGLPTLPGTVRVADGVPGGMDRRERIEAIGNAVYPPCAWWIGMQLGL